jgi:hypothetical protein
MLSQFIVFEGNKFLVENFYTLLVKHFHLLNFWYLWLCSGEPRSLRDFTLEILTQIYLYLRYG